MKAFIALLLPAVVSLTSCANERNDSIGDASATPEMSDAIAQTELQAVAEITPTEGNEARGTIRFTVRNGSLQLAGTIVGLEPGAHGFHIHEMGDCSAPDASSAGGHYNPRNDPHGSPEDMSTPHHVGDLGNLTASEEGTAEIDVTHNDLQLSGPESLIGKALIVHAGQDDLETQPSGDSGDPVGCGVIVASPSSGGTANF